LLAGATTVQIASALYKEGFDVIPEILKGYISLDEESTNLDNVDFIQSQA